MNNKEFEDFFKDLDPIEEPKKPESPKEEEDLVFSSFFEDATSKKTEEKEDFEFEDDMFAPPPPDEDEDEPENVKIEAEYIEQKEEPVKKNISSKTVDQDALKKRKKRLNTAYNWLLTLIWVCSVLAVSVFIAFFALSSINDLVGFNKESREVEITIPAGYDLSEIAELLEDKGIIDEPFTFEVYARVKNMETRLAPGTYVLNSNLGYDQIFQALKTKEVPKNVVKVNFYEGMTITDIAKRLEENEVCSYDEFIEEVPVRPHKPVDAGSSPAPATNG